MTFSADSFSHLRVTAGRGPAVAAVAPAGGAPAGETSTGSASGGTVGGDDDADDDGDDTQLPLVQIYQSSAGVPISASQWMPRLDRTRVLTPAELNLRWWKSTPHVARGNAWTQSYALALFSISSWAEQERVLSWYDDTKLEWANDEDDTVTAGAIRRPFDPAVACSTCSLAPNCDWDKRTWCASCRMPTSRHDRYRTCSPCGVDNL